ncbi:MAG: hypothetical protein R6T89_01895, partial [Candidatus Syntrophosphaera sp.]
MKKWLMTYALIITNFIVFVISLIYQQTIIQQLGFRPIYLTPELFPQIYTPAGIGDYMALARHELIGASGMQVVGDLMLVILAPSPC